MEIEEQLAEQGYEIIDCDGYSLTIIDKSMPILLVSTPMGFA